jgi:hypothetical protein
MKGEMMISISPGMIIYGNIVLTLFALAGFTAIVWVALSWEWLEKTAYILAWAGLLTGLPWALIQLWT